MFGYIYIYIILQFTKTNRANNEIITLLDVEFGVDVFVSLLPIDELFVVLDPPPHAAHFLVLAFQL